MYFDIGASGGSLSGLTRPLTNGGNYVPLLALEVPDCDATLTAPRGYTMGRVLKCDGERNEVVQTLGQLLRIALMDADGN